MAILVKGVMTRQRNKIDVYKIIKKKKVLSSKKKCKKLDILGQKKLNRC